MQLIEGIAAQLKHARSDMGSTIMTMPTADFRQDGTSEIPNLAEPGSGKNQFKIRLANLHGIRQEASVLIQERYAQRGYGAQKLNEDPNRLSIVAYENHEVIGTLSIGLDSPAGLLCDDLYHEELGALRASGRKACEFIKLAVVSSAVPGRTLAALFHVAFIYAYRIHHFDDVVIEVNPRHVKFYQRSLGFRRIGVELTNRRVNAPAVLMCCELSYIGEQIRRFAGHAEARTRENSIYPYGFLEQEEQGILERLNAMGAAQE